MNYLLMLGSVGATVLNNSLRNKFSKDKLKSLSDFCLFNALVSAVGVPVLLLFGRGFGSCSVYTLLLGLLFGVLVAGEGLVSLLALATGPMSYTNLFGMCGMIIPTFSGLLFWNETVKPVQYAGIALMLLSFALGVNPKKDKKMTGKWIALCVVLFLINGGLGLMQKIHQSSVHKSEMSAFLVIAFVFTAVALTTASFLFNRFAQPKTVSLRSSLGVCAAACGVCMAMIHHINIFLAGVMNSAFLFPVLNGACIMGAIIVSVVLFKEKLSKLQIFSLMLGVVAIMLLGNITDLIFK